MNYLMTLFTVDGGRLTKDGKRLLRNVVARLPLLLLLLPFQLSAQSDSELFPPKPDPAVYVHDYAGWLSAGERMALEQKLIQYYDSTSTQIVVMIRPDIGDYDKASYAFELGNRWGIGRKSKNNGVVLLVKTEQPGRGAFIATGYGVEGALPDITAGRIIRNTMIPYFKQERYAEGIDAGVDEIINALSGEYKNDESATPMPWWVPFLILAFIILFIVFMVRVAKKGGGQWYTDAGSLPGGRTRRGGGWWMGGGGGSGWGGGGNSGGWGGGGGFGGGSFGGGGAGGDW